MMGDYHVRFYERLGVKFPLSTRHFTVATNLKKMPLLLYSALLLLIVLLIKFFVDKKRNCGFKILTIFGIIIGLTSLGLNHLFDNAFGASTPVNIRTENLTNKNLKIYAIAFWDNRSEERRVGKECRYR